MIYVFRTLICVFLCLVLVATESCSTLTVKGSGSKRVETRGKSITPIIDFSEDSDAWRSIDDVVMGGVSASKFVVSDGIGVFKGNVSLENNGGFASARSKPGSFDLSDFDGLCIRIRGDGKSYGFRLRTNSNFDGISYQARFNTKAGEWIELKFDIDVFEAVFRGRKVPNADPLDPSAIKSFGVIISDKQEGPFQIEIDYIAAYKKDDRD